MGEPIPVVEAHRLCARLKKSFVTENWPFGRAETRSSLGSSGRLWFKSRAGKIGHSVASGLPPRRHFFEKSCVARRRHDKEIVPPTHYMFWSHLVSIIKDLEKRV